MMINIQEVIIHLQKKITQYRYQQKRTSKAKTYLQIGKEVLTSINNNIKHNILHQLNSYATTVMTNVIELQQHCEKQLTTQKTSYQSKINQMQLEILRQRKLITDMKKEVEDLQELIFIENSQRYQDQQPEKQDTEEAESKVIRSPNCQTINGLEIIEEEETDRTIMSSARSIQDERINQDNFIRIQQKDQNQEEQEKSFNKKQIAQFQPIRCGMIPSASSQLSNNQQSYEDQWQQQKSSIYKFQPFMQNSNFSKRQNTFNSQYGENQYQSLPLSMEGYFTKQLTTEQLRQDTNTWEEKLCSSAELKDITNSDKEVDSERQRQSKSKMFLEEFRKTFNKCLSSANISRKTSAKLQKSSNKTTDRGEKKSHRQTNKNDNQGHDNKKLINEMLRDIDNNNKFSVGNRRNQLKYQGERKDNTRHGHGTLYYLNGLCYQGQFKNNMRQGYGILKFNQIEIYRGEWNADQLSGQGKIRNFAVINKKKSQNSNNSPLLKWVSYCGYFRNNRFEGQGTLYLQGAQKFLGKFICGMACGQGTLYRKNGQIETGIWRNNQLVQQF